MSQAEGKEELAKACVLCGKEYPARLELCPEDGTLLTPIGKEPKVGDIFAERYEILGVIGDGGMGKVFKARHNLMKRIVAIKMLLPHLVQNAAALKRFTQEAQAASALKHPHILYVHDFGISDQGIPYLVMDYLEGINLSSLLQEQGRLPEERAIPIFIQACSALAHAHSKGVIHRDIKPANIMLIEFEGQKDYLQIVDFGIAKLLQPDGAEQLTHTGEVFGSPLYMSPEQCRGKELDARSDIYSLGCVLYRTVTGRPVFGGRDAMECMYKQVNDAPSPFSDVCPELAISEKLEAVVFKAIAKEPDGRFASMSDFREALESVNSVQTPAVHKLFSVPPQSGQVVAYDAVTDQLKRPSNLASTQYAGKAAKPESSAGSMPGQAQLPGQAAETEEKSPGLEVAAEVAPQPALAEPEKRPEPAETEVRGQVPEASEIAMAPEEKQNKLSESGTESGTDSGIESGIDSGKAAQESKQMLQYIGGGLAALLVIGLIAFASMQSSRNVPGNGPKQADLKPAQTHELVSKADKQLQDGDYKTAEQTLNTARQAASSVDKDLMQVLPRQAELYEEAGKFAQAQDCWSKYLELQKKSAASQSDMARTKSEIAVAMLDQKDVDGAEPLLSEAKQVLDAAPESEKSGLSQVLYGLSKIAVQRGDYNQAISYLQEAISRKGNSKDEDALQYKQDLAVIYSAQGNLKKSESLLNEVLKEAEQKFGSNSPQVANTYKNLATIYFQQNKFGKAETLFKKSLDLKIRCFGDGTESAAEVMAALAMLYTREGKYALAEPLFQKALEIRIRELGADSPQAVRTREALSTLAKFMKKGK